MSWRCCIVPLLLLLAAAGCKYQRGATPLEDAAGEIPLGPIDWDESAGVFIGIEKFHAADAPIDVDYAADDAADLAYLFTNELRLLPPAHTVVMLAGRPRKEHSRRHLEELTRQARVVLDEVDEKHVYDAIDQQVRNVGAHGALVLSIATHGYTTGGRHVLLTADSGSAAPKGVVLGNILRKQRRGRLLFFVDACRERLTQLPAPDSPTAMTEAFFEELRGGGYAVFSAAAPGGFAQADDGARNGFFTSALLDAFRRQTDAPSGGCALTLATLGSEVSRRVLERSGDRQRPEARFGGDLADLCVVDGVAKVGEIVYPPHDATVTASGDVEFRTLKAGLFATVLLCAARNGVCYNQTSAPVPAPARAVTRVHVQYGTPDRFDVYVALSADRKFLASERETAGPPLERSTNHVVRWLGPVTVTFPSVVKEPSS